MGARDAPPLEDDRPVAGLELPLATLDGAACVDRRQVDLLAGGEEVEHRVPVGRRLRKHERDRDGRRAEAVAQPRRGGVALGARRPSPAPSRGSLEREQAVEGERGAGQRRPVVSPRGRERPGSGPAGLAAPVPALERVDELAERVGRVGGRAGGQLAAGADEPRELGALLTHPGDELGDLPERHPPLAGALDVRPARRRLRRVPPVEDERIAEVVAVRDREEARPEVVVLALGEGRVVPEPVRVEHLTVDHHRRVEERRREERRPAHGAGPGRHPMDATHPTVVPEVDRAGPDDGRCRGGAHACREPLEPRRTRDVVRVEARDVAPARLADPDVERAGEAEGLLVPHDAEPRVVDTGEELTRAVDRAVVDDDELEIPERLPQHARHRLADRRACVAGREDDGDEGRAHRLAEGSLRRCPEPRARASISSSRPSVGRTSSTSSSARSRHRRIRRRACSSSTRTTTIGSPRLLASHPSLRIERVRSSARVVARPERRARPARGRSRRVPRRRLPLPAGAPRAGRRALRGGRGARCRLRPPRGRGRSGNRSLGLRAPSRG